MFERGMRVRLRDRLWEVEGVKGAGAEALLDLRRADGRPGPRRLTVVAGLEPTLRLEPATELRFEVGNPVRLSELHNALALTMAHGRADLLAVEHGRIDVEPYQLVPVLAAMRQPKVRLLVADDVGLGKTIEAGLVLMELARRGRADRVLIACPAGLQDQWVDEMRFRFNLEFTKVDSRKWLDLRRSYPTTVSPWTAAPFAVSSIDYLKTNLTAIQAAPPFDVVIIDEAHHVARAYAGEGRSTATDRSRLARTLADHARELILLSATPHNGYPESFASLLQLLSVHLAADDGRLDPGMVKPYVVRRLKDDVARGNPAQPISRRNPPQPIEVAPTAREKEIHRRLRGHSKRVLRALRDTDSYHVEAFALEVLRKRALSSPHALRTSLQRRAANLGVAKLDRAGRHRLEALQQYRGDIALTESDLWETEELALSGVAAHLPEDDLREEQRMVGTLLELVEAVTPADDSKLSRLHGWLEGFRVGRRGDRVIVFTEYRDTLDYLEEHLGLGPILRIDGSLPLRKRREVLETFAHTPGAILLATDAAGEGLNLQDACHVVVHYELPWNPNRLEQRNGRVDRYGQVNVVEISYLYLADTRDEEILQRLREKLAEIARQLGSSSDVLGVGGQSDVIDALLEDLPLEELEARLERAAQQVRDYLSTSGALEVLRSLPDERQAEAETTNSRQRASWILPDFDEYRELVASVVRQCGGHIRGGDRIMTITPGPLLAQYPHVPAEPFPATFLRAVALDPDHRGVAFLTPVHPLVRAVLQRVRTRLYDARAEDRVAVRPVAGTGSGWLFTATGRIQADDGRLLEEPLIPVFVPRLDDGTPGTPSRDETADAKLLRARPAYSSDDSVSQARKKLADGFATARHAAMGEAARRLAERARQIRTQLAADANRLAADLERWRQAELAEARRRFATGFGDAVQLSIFADAGHGAFHTIDEAEKIVEEEFNRRRDALQRGFGIANVADPEPVGCMLCVEVGSC
ncbi:SNF2 family N-terminal domain-containing protein [Micromonospora haikouensis]|uniref:SNF2 family N-terminal domain-containing protein n=1 Tax=Micromonospora haikouensis TaxID=686309 RepID=A0A1C4YI27_9ACTN|nr:helicase-related protein [Micromonospora haikouensis]SCF20296.1 SNF2 family N-terminal domain-containing protein [Micromonospora haikouensis]